VRKILVTHGISTTPKTLKMVAEKTGAPFAGMVELMGYFAPARRGKHHGLQQGGGTIRCGKLT